MTSVPLKAASCSSLFASALLTAVLIVVMLPASSHAQARFERTYGGAENDWALSAQQIADGGFVLVGASCSFGRAQQLFIARTTVAGDTLWTRTLGGYANDLGCSVQQTADGDFIVAGYTDYFSTDVYLVRIDASGNVLWSKRYGGDSLDVAESVEPTTDGGFIVAGFTRSFGAGSADFYLLKTDANGDTLWTRTYGGSYMDEGKSVRQTADGGYIVVGGCGSQDDLYAVKTDADGDAEWTRTYGGTGYDIANAVLQVADGGYVIVGTTRSFGAGEADFYLVRTDANGNTRWTNTYGGENNDFGYSVEETPDGGLVLAGATQSFGEGAVDVYVVATDSSGRERWARTFGGDSNDCAYSIRLTADSGYIVAGYTRSFGAGGEDAYLIKTDSLGRVAVAEPKSRRPRGAFPSLSCEPNPFRRSTRIRLSVPTADSERRALLVYNAGGRLVRTLTIGPESCVLWEGKDDAGRTLPTGTYFVRCDGAGQRATARLVLQH